MSEFSQFLADCWRMFTDVQVPILNISFAQLWLGIFVVGVSIVILRPLLGIGFGAANNIFTGIARAGKRGYDNASSKSRAAARERYNNSYEKYKSDHDRLRSYAKRYRKESR